jgi:hypothetical protein
MVRISMTLSDMSDSCMLQSFCSNYTSYYFDDNYMNNGDYFVVMVCDNHYSFDTFACLD